MFKDQKLFTLIKRFFAITGWFFFLVNAFQLLILFLQELGFHASTGEINLFEWTNEFIQVASVTLFSFLMQEVFTFLAQRDLKSLEKVRWLVHFTVASFFLSALCPWISIVGVLGNASSLPGMNNFDFARSTFSEMPLPWISLFLSTLLPSVKSLFIGLTIAALFKYLMDFMKFESEVI